MTNVVRIFREKEDTKFKDKYTEQIYTVKELNEGFLKPTIGMTPEALDDFEDWLERFEKV